MWGRERDGHVPISLHGDIFALVKVYKLSECVHVCCEHTSPTICAIKIINLFQIIALEQMLCRIDMWFGRIL